MGRYQIQRKKPPPKNVVIPPSAAWNRQSDNNEIESSEAYELFIFYRDLGTKRKQAEVSRHFKLNVSRVSNIAKRWKWDLRCMAWEDFQIRQKDEETISNIQKMNERHAKESMIMQTLMLKPTEIYNNKLAKLAKEGIPSDLEKLSEEELIKIIMMTAEKYAKLVDVERKSRGEPTDINLTQIDWSKLSDDDIRQIANPA